MLIKPLENAIMSPLTRFARSVRNEVVESKTPDHTEPADPFAGIDLDDLPEALRKNVQTAKDAFIEQQKNAQQLKQKEADAIKFARDQQSRADKAQELLKKHNLDGTQSPSPNPNNLDSNPLYGQLCSDLETQGLKPEVAKAYAKLFVTTGQATEKSVLDRVAKEFRPLVDDVASSKAESALSELIKEDSVGVFKDDSVLKEVQDNVKLLLSNGQAVDKETVKSLAAMAAGNAVMKAAKEGKQPSFMVQQTTPISMGGQHTGGFAVTRPAPRSGPPPSPNAETAAAVAAAKAALEKMVGKKGASK